MYALRYAAVHNIIMSPKLVSSNLIKTSKSVYSTFVRLEFSTTTVLRDSPLNGPDQILEAPDHRTWLPDGAVQIRMDSPGPQNPPPISVPTMFRKVVEDLPNHLALGTRGPTGEPLRWTYIQYHTDVVDVAKGFISLGLDRFHSVAILGYNSPEWVISSLAAVHAGGFATGIYQTNNPEACWWVAHNSRANVVVVEDELQLQKVVSVRSRLPHLRAIIMWRGKSGVPGVLSWKELLDIGRNANDALLEERLKQIAINQCCLLIYTSGTTGNPKGAMISHDGATFAQSESAKIFGWDYGKDVSVSYLPLSHLAGTGLDIHLAISRGATVYFADPNALKGTLIENLKEYQPTRFLGVPRVWEKIEEKMKEVAKENKGVKKVIANWAKSMGTRHHEILMAGGEDNSLGYRLARKLVLSRVHKALGMGRINGVVTGSAITPENTLRYFQSLDLQLCDIYGSTESNCLMAANLPRSGSYRLGTVGRGFPLMETKITNKNLDGVGEMVSRGRAVFMGYINNRELTLETVDDEGWLHTGDLVKQDKDGFFSVVGRIKEIVVTAGGKNITPTNIEQEIVSQLPDIISNVVVVGDNKKFLTCLITFRVEVDPETLAPTTILDSKAKEWIENQGGGSPVEVQELLTSDDWPKVEAAIQRGINRANKNAESGAATVKNWKILPQEFSVEGGELTPTLKLKRFHVANKYKQLIDQMY